MRNEFADICLDVIASHIAAINLHHHHHHHHYLAHLAKVRERRSLHTNFNEFYLSFAIVIFIAPQPFSISAANNRKGERKANQKSHSPDGFCPGCTGSLQSRDQFIYKRF